MITEYPRQAPLICPELRFLAAAPAGWTAGSQDRAAVNAAVDLLHCSGLLLLREGCRWMLLCDAQDPIAVAELRRRAHQDETPLVVFPSLEIVQENCRISETEQTALLADDPPVLRLPKRRLSQIAAAVAPGGLCLPVLLPKSPLLRLLLARFRGPLASYTVAHGEPPERAAEIADGLLATNCPENRANSIKIARTS